MNQNDLKYFRFYRWRQAYLPTTTMSVRKKYVQKYTEDLFFMVGIETFYQGVYKCKGIVLETIENSDKKIGNEAQFDFYYGPRPLLKVEYNIQEIKFNDLSESTKTLFWNNVFSDRGHLILNLRNNFNYYKRISDKYF